jgi:hypothetical protein
MVLGPDLLPPRVGLRVGRRLLPAVPFVLSGHEASLVLAAAAPTDSVVRLVLDWPGGAVTELDARVTALEEAGRIAHLEVEQVQGDWRPFLDWLGRQTLAG